MFYEQVIDFTLQDGLCTEYKERLENNFMFPTFAMFHGQTSNKTPWEDFRLGYNFITTRA